jgi:aromatic-L-amino-acid decarboxylase
VIQGTASEATLVSMVAARERARQAGAEDDQLVAYASEHAHSSVIKGAMIAGIARGPEDRERVRLVPTDDAYALRPDALAAMMREDRDRGRRPFYICATVGTTSTTAVDPVDGVCAAAAETGATPPPWVHVDAAFSGAAWICPEHRASMRGLSQADSVCFNPHKWLLTSFDCDCLWTRDRRTLVNALSVTPEYLRNAASQAGSVIDYRDWQVPLGRRFRALKLWFVIRHYGVEGLQAYIREHLRLAALFESWVRGDHRFEVIAPRTASLVCFRLRPGPGEDAEQTNARTKALLDAINAGGSAYLSHTVVPVPNPGGPKSFVLRMAIGASSTQERHVRAAWDLVREHTGRLAAGTPTASA